MKRSRTFAYLFAISLLSVTVAGCGKQSVPSNKMSELILDVDQFTDFAVDDLFLECANMTVKARYENGLTYTLDESKYQIVLMRYNSLVNFNEPFSHSGNYVLRVKSIRDGLYSNTFSFSVSALHMYTSKLSVTGPSSAFKGQTVRMIVETDGRNFGGEITCTCYNPSYVTINKVAPRIFEVTGSTAPSTYGFSNLTFVAHKSATETIEYEKPFEVVNKSKTEIKQTQGDYQNRKTHLAPSIGTARVLVVPIWYTTSSTYVKEDKKANILEDLNTALFGNPEETGWHSLSSYYSQESKGMLTISGTVADFYESSYDGSMSNSDHLTYVENDIKNAVNFYFANHLSDSRYNYDADHNGYIDTVIGVPIYPYIRAYKWRIGDYDPNISKPNIDDCNWVSYENLYNAENALARTGYAYSSGENNNRLLDPTVFIHEFGHSLGQVDLYDYITNSDGTPPEIDDTGGFNMQTDGKCGHDPYSVMSFGWADPYIPTTSEVVTLNDFQSSNELILLTPEWNSYDSPFDEYLLLELYSPTGLNEYYVNYVDDRKAPDVVGIRVWHIDSILFHRDYSTNTGYYTSDCHDVNDNGYYPSLVRSNGYSGIPHYGLVRLMRSPHSSSYLTTDKFRSVDLLVEGEQFLFSNFADQFPQYEYNHVETLDNGKELGWRFKVLDIFDNGNGTYSASIDLTRIITY